MRLKSRIMAIAALCIMCGMVAVNSQTAGAIKRFSIGTAGTAGALYPMGVAMGQTITKHVAGLAATGEATAASVENIRNLSTGKLTMGISQNEIAWLAFHGLGDFKQRKSDMLRSLFSTIYSYIQVFAKADGPVSSIKDFKGKAIGVGAAGSGGEMATRMVLEYFGLTYNDIKPQFIPETEAVSALKDGRIAAFVCTHPLKSAALLDLTNSSSVKMISIAEDGFYTKFPFYSRFTIPPNTYKGVDYPVTVPISRVIMLTTVNPGLSNDEVYAVVKAIWENRAEWSSVHASVNAQVTFEAALKELSVPMHLGAIQYFLEKGVKIDDSLFPPEYKK
jgi:TRAP transporter TAXI family solute receptor